MKINDPTLSPGAGAPGVTGPGRNQESAPAGPGSKVRGAYSGRGDQVALSNLSSTLSAHQADSPQHAARLAKLTSDVSLGHYWPDSHSVSASIIQQSTRA